ncbi:hypothetical protein OH77DRAFT_1021092 [Trametes cingulata]|nr:hypothetical protein OH77DRAFT_1021092 [Trametes cingulata]
MRRWNSPDAVLPAIPKLSVHARSTAAGSATVGLSPADTPPRLCTEPCNSHLRHPSCTLCRVRGHACITHAKSLIFGSSAGRERRRYGSRAPLAGTSTLADQIAAALLDVPELWQHQAVSIKTREAENLGAQAVEGWGDNPRLCGEASRSDA